MSICFKNFKVESMLKSICKCLIFWRNEVSTDFGFRLLNVFYISDLKTKTKIRTLNEQKQSSLILFKRKN